MKKDYDEEYEVLATHPDEDREYDTCIVLTDIRNGYIFEDRWQMQEDCIRDYFDTPGYGDLAPVFRTCLSMHKIQKVSMTFAEYADLVKAELIKPPKPEPVSTDPLRDGYGNLHQWVIDKAVDSVMARRNKEAAGT